MSASTPPPGSAGAWAKTRREHRRSEEAVLHENVGAVFPRDGKALPKSTTTQRAHEEKNAHQRKVSDRRHAQHSSAHTNPPGTASPSLLFKTAGGAPSVTYLQRGALWLPSPWRRSQLLELRVDPLHSAPIRGCDRAKHIQRPPQNAFLAMH
ncbi:hypothetical protein TcCL_Unassigned01260 [Trypanosoma cruzi]|uniref:TC3_47I12.3 n=1 Tax=Trypanosoma cruzi TaxID=5693 RepID=Q8T2X4_TRYCR|nr:TC3_47I12.3 [Trypanosoma cruzi]RNC35835.1 hypothetical protein TcCL_Unassigned01260 [Trypanosoma cruzi]